jgi:hypothetical protein
MTREPDAEAAADAPADDASRLETVREVWRILGEHGDPSALFAPDAQIHGSAFGSFFRNDRADTVEERMSVIRERPGEYHIALKEVIPAPGERVLAIGGAGWGAGAGLVAVVYAFRGARITRSEVFHHAEAAFRAAGLPPSADWRF